MTSGFVPGPERTLFDAGFLSIRVGEFTTPDGERVERQIVRHPGAVVILPLDGDEVVLVRQYRAPIDRAVLELPAGKRDVEHEAPAVTAARELAEEVGLEADELVELTTFVNSPGFCDETTVLFLATGLTAVERDVQDAEEAHMDIVRLGLDDALAAIDSGEIGDAKTIIGLLLVERRRRRG